MGGSCATFVRRSREVQRVWEGVDIESVPMLNVKW